ncbi:BRO-N domain-containing protein [Pararobbsia alpina]|uniref:Bro-N domain-containing protein n=1 Tax=Pararobbsia alpina TaxID=621374 RepID=A0A6S7B956_9BURK|nr:Bro-N domain-containing protein [Pararobbsia alpina]CAB3783380.1 hypothetical protein LMG28138_01628 [Pararobbsia alpina]
MSYELQAKQIAPVSDDRFNQVLGAVADLTKLVTAIVGSLVPNLVNTQATEAPAKIAAPAEVASATPVVPRVEITDSKPSHEKASRNTSPAPESTAVSPFNFEGKDVRVIERDGEPWFVGSDVCDVLEIAKVDSALRGLDADEKGTHTVSTLGGAQRVGIISEPGLYALLAKSRKPEARRFKRWVTSKVLPAIRKTGNYVAPRQEQPKRNALATAPEGIGGALIELNFGPFFVGVRGGVRPVYACVRLPVGMA